MAIDYVSVLRSAPNPEQAIDNALFLAAKEASFLAKDIQLGVTEIPICKIQITKPSLLIGGFRFTDTVDVRIQDLTPTANPSGFICEFSGYSTAGATPWATTTNINFYATVTSVDSKSLFVHCKIAPAFPWQPITLALMVKSSTGAKVLADSYFKLV
jgi:hypothetical protein